MDRLLYIKEGATVGLAPLSSLLRRGLIVRLTDLEDGNFQGTACDCFIPHEMEASFAPGNSHAVVSRYESRGLDDVFNGDEWGFEYRWALCIIVQID